MYCLEDLRCIVSNNKVPIRNFMFVFHNLNSYLNIQVHISTSKCISEHLNSYPNI